MKKKAASPKNPLPYGDAMILLAVFCVVAVVCNLGRLSRVTGAFFGPSGEAYAPVHTAAVAEGYLLDVNLATAEQFEALPGIGPAIAKRIVAYREENGPFASVDGLLGVSGIGEKTLSELYPYLTVGEGDETAPAPS